MRKYNLIKLINILFFIAAPAFAYSYSGVGYYCESYTADHRYNDWSFKNCQKVIYHPDGRTKGVEPEKIDINFVNCPSHITGPNSCEGLITDKKKYPYYYGYAVWAGAAMPEGLDFWDIYVLNDKNLSQGTKIEAMTLCVHHTEYGLENCRKLP